MSPKNGFTNQAHGMEMFLGGHRFAVDGCAIKLEQKQIDNDGTMDRWYNGSMVTTTQMKTRTRMTMMTSFFDITTNLVVGCIPVREAAQLNTWQR